MNQRHNGRAHVFAQDVESVPAYVVAEPGSAVDTFVVRSNSSSFLARRPGQEGPEVAAELIDDWPLQVEAMPLEDLENSGELSMSGGSSTFSSRHNSYRDTALFTAPHSPARFHGAASTAAATLTPLRSTTGNGNGNGSGARNAFITPSSTAARRMSTGGAALSPSSLATSAASHAPLFPAVDTTIRRVNIGGAPVNVIGPSLLLHEETAEGEGEEEERAHERRRTFGNDGGDYRRFRAHPMTSGGNGGASGAASGSGNSGGGGGSRVSAQPQFRVESLVIGGERVNIITLGAPGDALSALPELATALPTAQPQRRGQSSSAGPLRSQTQHQHVVFGAPRWPSSPRNAHSGGSGAHGAGRGGGGAVVRDTSAVDAMIRTVNIGGQPVNIIAAYQGNEALLSRSPTAAPSTPSSSSSLPPQPSLSLSADRAARQQRHRNNRFIEPVVARPLLDHYDAQPVNAIVRTVNIGGQPVNILQAADAPMMERRVRLPSFHEDPRPASRGRARIIEPSVESHVLPRSL